MAFTQNQISDYVQNAIGRPATDYEYKTYMNASPQTLANLPDYYKGLNKDNSVSDYLLYQGKDPESRNALATQYGISNFNTAEGQTALLNALKGITTPTTPTVSGSISSATPETKQPTGQPSERSPETSSALEQYKSVQTQIADIDKAINESLANKRAQVIASGGIVDEAQLKSTVLAEQAPLLNQRKALVSQQSIIGKQYQDLVQQDKQRMADYFKQASLEQKGSQFDVTTGLKRDQLAEKSAVDQVKLDQAAQKLEQSGWKKVSDYSDGTKVGEHFVNVNGQKVTLDPETAQPVLVGSGSAVGSQMSAITGSPANITKGDVTYTDFAAVPDAPTDQNRNTVYPGTAGKTYGAVYEDAVTYAETGKYQKMGVSSKPSTKAYDNAVKAKASNIAASLGMTEDQLRVAYKANSTAMGKLITQKATVSAFENKARAQVDIILNGYIDPRTGEKVPSLNTSVSRTDYPLVNGLYVKGKILAGDTNAQLLSNALITFTTEYAKIMSGSTGSAAASTDAARREASSLISTALTQGTLEKTLGLLQKEMDTTIQGYNDQIQSIGGSFVGAKTAQTPQTDITKYKAISFDVPKDYQYDYQRDYQKAQEAVANGSDPAQVWGYFNSLYK